MKILIGMPAKDSWGGPASSEPPFAAALKKLGANVIEETYVFGDKEKPTPIFERIRRVIKTALRFRRILQKENFDIIHLNTAFDFKTLLRDGVALRLMKPKRAKVFLKIHGSETKYLKSKNPLIVALRNNLRNLADGFGIHTPEEKTNFLQAGFDEQKFFFVKNAVTVAENLPPNFSRCRKEKEDVFRLLFVARFIPAKGLLETIRAGAILKSKGCRFILNCIGDGTIRGAAESEVQRLQLTENVKFSGYIPENEVTNYFFNSDIFVFPTRHAEGFPNVLFKAVAVGLPVVTTRVRAANDYLHEPKNCLFSTQSPENIAEKIIELIENKTLRETMCENNLKFGKTLAPESIAREFLEIYEKILDTNPKSKI
ncbi:MAG: glycosyltransferase family 4 protein [Pyrinomonadaceae bacterium]